MREGINFGRVRTNSQCKIPKKKLNKPTLSRKINLKRLKHSQETVTGKSSKEKKTREFSSIKLIEVQVFHPSVLSFNEKVIGLAITVTYWLMWLFVTCVRQLSPDSLEARHLVITQIAHAQTFDRCLDQEC